MIIIIKFTILTIHRQKQMKLKTFKGFEIKIQNAAFGN